MPGVDGDHGLGHRLEHDQQLLTVLLQAGGPRLDLGGRGVEGAEPAGRRARGAVDRTKCAFPRGVNASRPLDTPARALDHRQATKQATASATVARPTMTVSIVPARRRPGTPGDPWCHCSTCEPLPVSRGRSRSTGDGAYLEAIRLDAASAYGGLASLSAGGSRRLGAASGSTARLIAFVAASSDCPARSVLVSHRPGFSQRRGRGTLCVSRLPSEADRDVLRPGLW